MNFKVFLAICLVSLCPLQEIRAVSLKEFFSSFSQLLSRAKPTYDLNEPYYGLNNKSNIPHAIGAAGALSIPIFGCLWYRAKRKGLAACNSSKQVAKLSEEKHGQKEASKKSVSFASLEQDKLEEQRFLKQHREQQREEAQQANQEQLKTLLYDSDTEQESPQSQDPVAELTKYVLCDAFGTMLESGLYLQQSANTQFGQNKLKKNMEQVRAQGLENSPQMQALYKFVDEQEMNLCHGIIRWGPEKTESWKREVNGVRDAVGFPKQKTDSTILVS